jgi:2-polyprenyl-3-methyl-5-hydroxy-6-metoxy-1,4-benzoquinol methylase
MFDYNITLKTKSFIKNSIIGTQYEWQNWFEIVPYLIENNIRSFKPKNLLDIGCNDGSRTIFLANQLNIAMHSVYGVDIDVECISTCRQKFNAEIADLEQDRLPYDDEFFDLTVCNQVLEHLKYYENVIHESIRVTRKGGYILIGIPNLSHLINRLLLLFGVQPMCMALDGPHVRGFTHKAFLRLLRSFRKIDVIDQTGTVMYPLPFIIAKHMARYFVGLSGYTFYILRKRNE